MLLRFRRKESMQSSFFGVFIFEFASVSNQIVIFCSTAALTLLPELRPRETTVVTMRSLDGPIGGWVVWSSTRQWRPFLGTAEFDAGLFFWGATFAVWFRVAIGVPLSTRSL